MTPETLSSVAGILLSLLFSYVPGLSDWFDKQTPNYKRIIMLVALVAVVLGVVGLSCAKFSTTIECSQNGATQLVYSFVAAAIANQAAFLLSPRKA